MLTFEELKNKIESFPEHVEDQSIKNEIRIVAEQLGFTVPNCKCQDKFNDLVVKLKLWSRQHPTECHFKIRAGIVRRTPWGNAYNLNLTDEMAEWILENDQEGARFITKIIEIEQVQSEVVEPKKRTPRKRKSQS